MFWIVITSTPLILISPLLLKTFGSFPSFSSAYGIGLPIAFSITVGESIVIPDTVTGWYHVASVIIIIAMWIAGKAFMSSGSILIATYIKILHNQHL